MLYTGIQLLTVIVTTSSPQHSQIHLTLPLCLHAGKLSDIILNITEIFIAHFWLGTVLVPVPNQKCFTTSLSLHGIISFHNLY